MSNFKFNWAPWARLQTIGAAMFILIGAVITYFYPPSTFKYFIGNLVSSVFLLSIEYFNIGIPVLTTNYYVKGLLVNAVGVLGMMVAPTTTGGLCMFCAGLTYWRAAVNGESSK